MPTPGSETVVVPVGETAVRLPPRGPSLEPVTWDGSMHCSESGTIEGSWTGIELAGPLLEADPPDETTHVLVSCRDGLRVCITIRDALDALLAYERDGESLLPDAVRLVGPPIGSTRSAIGVERVEPIHVAPATDPSEYEELKLLE